MNYHEARYRLRALYLSTGRVFGSLVDSRRGFDTATYANLEDLGLAHPQRTRYEPSSWLNLRRALRSSDIYAGDVFLDYGCGKGRVLIAAARLPFDRVIGVEISADLLEVARVNLDADQGRRRCASVQLVAADVTDWVVPDDVTVVFMFNPFRGDVFDSAIKQLLASLDRNPRRLRLVYSVPLEEPRLLATRRARCVRHIAGIRPTRNWSRKMGVRTYEIQ